MIRSWTDVGYYFLAAGAGIHRTCARVVCKITSHDWKFNGGDPYCVRCSKYKLKEMPNIKFPADWI